MIGVRALALALAALAWAGAPHAETVRVLSGEHDGFTRLALVYEAPVGWRFGRAGGGYELRVDRDGIAYDIARVFDLVPRTRLAALEAGPAGLRLEVAADTRAVPFELRPGVVVIDIRDGAPDPGAATEQWLDPVRPPDPRGWALGLEMLGLDRPAPAPAPLPMALGPGPLAATVGPLRAPPEADDTAAADLDGTRRLLAAQIARAAAQGLLEARAPQATQLPAVALPATGGGDGGQHVDARTSIDREAPPATAPGPRDDAACRDAEALWRALTAPDDALAALAAGRAALYDDRDRVAGPEAVVRLVHANLALGFGAEARAVLASFPGVVASAPALSAVARLIDGEAVGPGGALAGLDRCAEAGALWAFLATPGTVPPDPAAVDAVVRAVSALPPHLRDHLGPVVAQRLAQAGLRDAALAVRDAMARGPGTDAGGIVNAALAPPADPAAEAGLLAIVAADGPGAAAALATFVEGRIAAGLPVQPETAQDAAIFAREARGGPGADRLARAAVLARAASGDLAGAVAALAGLAGDPVADAETRAAVFDLVTRRADDPTFLVIALEGLVGANPVRPTGAAAVAMAERLLALGFGHEAEAMLASAGAMAGRAAEGASPAGAGADAAMLLRARAGLAAGDPAAALRRLAGGDGPAAEALRAEALEALGDLRGATAAWQRAGLPEAAARTAWAAADWRSVVEVAAATAAAADVPDPRAPLVARLAALASDAAAEPAASPQVEPAAGADAVAPTEPDRDTGAGVLARARTLLDQSRAVREDVAALRARLAPLPAAIAPTAGAGGT